MPFGKAPAVYTTPDVRYVGTGAPWLSDAAVSSWSVDRELVASVVPGTLRSGGGLSIGSANLTAISTESRVSPWSPIQARRVTTGLPPGRLEVIDEDGNLLPLGAWVVAPTSGALSSRELAIELLEAQYSGRTRVQNMTPNGPTTVFDDSVGAPTPVDPMWVVGQMAAAAGFPSVPRTAPSALIDVPLYGAVGSVNRPVLYGGDPAYQASGLVLEWGEQPGGNGFGPTLVDELPYWMVASSSSSEWGGTQFTTGLQRGEPMFITANIQGTVSVSDSFHGLQIMIVNDPDTDTHTVGICNDGSGNYVTTAFVPGESADWPTRVQVEVTREWVTDEVDDEGGTWLSATVRARTGPAVGWSAPATDSTPWVQEDDYGAESIVFEGGSFTENPDGWMNGLQLTTAADPELWEPRRAILASLGGPLADAGLPWVPPGVDAWTAIRDACSAWLGAAVVGTDGVLRILNRDDLNRLPDEAGVIVVDDDLADLPWSLDPNDVPDRLVINFAAAVVRETDFMGDRWSPAVWAAEDVIHVPAFADVIIDAAFEDAATTRLHTGFAFDNGTSTTPIPGMSTLWTADNADGTGNTNADALRAQCWLTSPTTARVLLRNVTGASVFLVDPEGDPSLVLRGQTVATYAETETVERGVRADRALNPLEVDLKPWVQRKQEATTVADYLWGRLGGRELWKATSVRCRLDWTLDIGQVRMLTHPDSGLDAKALITKVHYDGQPGEIAQTLDLVLLPWSYTDFAAAWNAVGPDATYADFAAAQGGTRTYADMATDHNWTGVA